MKKRSIALLCCAALLAAAGCGTPAQADIVPADNLHGAVFDLTLEQLENGVNAAFDDAYGGQLLNAALGWTSGGEADYYDMPVDVWLCSLQAGTNITLAVNAARDTGRIEDVMLLMSAEDYAEQSFILCQAAASVARALLPELSASGAERLVQRVVSGDHEYCAGGNTLWTFTQNDEKVILLCSAVTDDCIARMTAAGTSFGAIQ